MESQLLARVRATVVRVARGRLTHEELVEAVELLGEANTALAEEATAALALSDEIDGALARISAALGPEVH